MNEALNTSGRACYVVGNDKDSPRLEHSKYLLKKLLLVSGVVQRQGTGIPIPLQ